MRRARSAGRLTTVRVVAGARRWTLPVVCGWGIVRENLAQEPATDPVERVQECVQECVQEWKRKGCESRLRPSHPARLTPYVFSTLAKTPAPSARSRVRRVASYTKGQ